jgi:Na+(H+)/acetate symporter ActP
MDLSEDLDSLNGSTRDRRSIGMTLLIVAVFASLFMVLFLYSPVLWAILCAVAFAVASGFVITTILLGIRDKRRAWIISPLVGSGLLIVLWFAFKAQQSSAGQPAQAGRAAAAPAGRPAAK